MSARSRAPIPQVPALPSSPRGPSLPSAVRWCLVMLGATAILTSLCRTGLTWDGSYILFSSLHEHAPLITHARYTSGILLWPVVWLSSLTSNTFVLSVAFSAVFAVIPLLAVALCWWLLRSRRPELIVWPVLGICLVTLPGQIFLASEAIAACQLFWVVVVWLCVGAPRRWLATALAISVAVAFFHPAGGGLLCVGGSGFALHTVRAVRVRQWRRAAIGAAATVAYLIAGVVRIKAIESTGYEQSSFTREVLTAHFHNAILGAPLVALIALAVVAVVMGLRLPPRVVRVGLTLGFAVVAVTMLTWATQPGWWLEALDYRSWAPLLSAASMGWCLLTVALRRGGDDGHDTATVTPRALRESDGTVEARGSRLGHRPGLDPEPSRTAAVSVLLAAAVFTAVMAVQSVLWQRDLSHLSARLDEARATAAAGQTTPGLLLPPRGGPSCLAAEALDSDTRVASHHWAVGALSVMLQGRDPAVFVTDDRFACLLLGQDSAFYAPYRDSPTDGWFELRRR